MKKLSQRQALFASSFLCGATLIGANQANAQAAAAPDSGSAVQEVVVTGSRIPRANLESASPLTVVSAGEVKAEGVVNIENLLNNLPSVYSGQNSTISNGSNGTATVDLRGLGPVRTLVLIDGRRLGAGDPGDPVPDLNFIPAPLVERVDVLTGGASSTYGADAVAGVVNFVMKRNFEGIQIDAQYGFDQSGNGSSDAAQYLGGNPFGSSTTPVEHVPGAGTNPLKVPGSVTERNNSQVSVIMGANSPDGKGNVTAYAEYTNLQPILENSRDFSDCSLTAITSIAGAAKGLQNNKHICAGSSNNAYGRFNVTATGKSFTSFLAPAGTFTSPYTNAADFNYGPLNYFQRSDDRYNLGAFGHYQVNDKMDVYMDTMFMDDHTVAQIAPSGFFQGPTYDIPCSNAFLSATQAGQLGCTTSGPTSTQVIPATIGFRLLGSNRQDDLRHTDYRIVLGTKGEFAEGWNYDVYAQYSAAIYSEHYLNDVSEVKLQNALNTTSTTTCVSGGACVPINIFNGPTGPSKASLAYVLTPGLKEGETTEEVVEADINGDLGQYGLKSPFAKEGVKVSFGTDYRRESLSETVDNEFSSGDLTGQGAATPPAAGSFNLYEVYTELSVPVISDLPFVKSLDFDGGYRYSEYNDVGSTETYKVALEYAPIADIKFRGSFNHAVRAPTIDELYQPDTVSLFAGADPCAGAADPTTHLTKAGASQAQCAASGVTADEFGKVLQCPSNQCTELSGGNAALKPESSDTTSFGVVFTPTFIKNFSMTVDFYNIKVNNIITGIAPTVSLSQCVFGDVSSFCSLIHRDASGTLLGPEGYVTSTDQNTGYLQTKGYDFGADYRFKLEDIAFAGFAMPAWGSMTLNFEGTYVESYIVEPVGGVPGTYNCAGLYGATCGQPLPHFRSKTRLTWSTPWNFDISGQWRYVGGVKLDYDEGNPLLQNGYYDQADEHLAGISYFDLTGDWHVKDGLTIRAGVNNIMDKDPPVVATEAQGSYNNGNTYPGVYDALGRTFFLSLTAKF